MAFFSTHTEDYYKKLIELQEKLRKSEEERLKLEMKFNEMTQITREEEQMHFRKLRSQYKRFLEEDRRRQDRNERIARSLDRIESRVSMLMAKTERFKLLRQQYHSFLNRIYNNNQCIPEKTNAGGADVENYIKTLSTDKLNELLHKEEDARRRLPFTKPSYSEETPKKTTFFGMADEEIRPNYANSIADDIMNEIYAKKNKELKLNKQPTEFEKGTFYDNNPSLFVQKISGTTIETPLPYFRENVVENKEVKYAQGMPVDQTFRNENPIERNLVQEQFEKVPNNSHNEKLSSNVCLSPGNQSRLNESKSSENVEFILEQNENIGMENVNKVLNENINRHHGGDNIIFDENNAGLEIRVGNEVDGLIKQQDINENNQLEGENCLEMQKIDRMNENILLEENSDAQSSEQINQVKVKESEDNSQASEQKNRSDLNPEQFDINAENMQECRQYDEREGAVKNYEEIGLPDQQLKAEHQQKYNENGQIVQEHEENRTQEYNNNDSEQSIPIQHRYNENEELVQPYDESEAQPLQQYDEQSQPIQHYDDQGQSIQQYDDHGQPMQQYDDQGQLMQQYDDQTQPIQHYNNQGQLMQQYDDQGQHMQQYDDQGQSMQQYDDQGQPIQQYDDHGQPMQKYDDHGQPMQQYDDQGQLMQQYDDQGQPVQQYDNQGQPMQQFDDQGQLMQQYDDQGQPILQYDDQGQPMQQQYDDQGQPMQQYDDQGQPIQQYDDQGQPMQQYNDQGQLMQHQYDENGQLIGQYDINSQYDESGQLIGQYDEQGQLINQYNDHPIEEQQQQYDENGQPVEYSQHEAQYDDNGQLIQYSNNEQYYNNPEQVEAENRNDVVIEEKPVLLSEQEKVSENNVEKSAEKPKNVMEMLDTDTESAKQDTTKISNNSDFDFSNN